ncbi:pentapeptide repeat-containing protein [Microcoleus sp. CAWBG58]|uniref:pentapeptide repeat-containing protein n=1 Tax=Microcoleus sp. CAWBG58 TaxID=2841651 RepID=UPI0026004E04|nr:pentapeptide repeat-containing protein [Microcoleus sp. CAWBG58]
MTTTKSGKKLKVQNLLLKLKLKLNKPLEHLSRHSTKYGVLLTLVVVLLAVFVLEPPQDPEPTPQIKQNNSVIKTISNSKLLGQFQNFGVILVAIIYLLEKPKRQKEEELKAWQLIDGAIGAETSGARFQAIQELHKMGASLKGLDADGADLRGINLQRANLEGASFKNALLQGANLEGANLKNAQLQKAQLQGANLKGVDFEGANLEGAELEELGHTIYDNQSNESKYEEQRTDLEDAFLRNTDLRGAFLIRANLKNAKFYNADLSAVHFNGADLEGAIFKDATLNGTRFGNTKLTLEQVNSAKDWKDALYDKSFCDENPTMDLSPDELGELIKENDVDKNRKIVSHEMLHNIAALLKEMETNNSVCLQDNLIVKDFKTALENLIENEKEHKERSAIRKAQLKRLGIKLKKAWDDKENNDKKNQQVLSEMENLQRADESHEESYRLARQWLESNREIILNSKGVRDYVDTQSETKLDSGVIDLNEQLKIDIDKCLIKICNSLEKFDADHETTDLTDLKIPSDILAEALKLIVEKVIPEEKQHSNNLSDDTYDHIKYYFVELINKLH